MSTKDSETESRTRLEANALRAQGRLKLIGLLNLALLTFSAMAVLHSCAPLTGMSPDARLTELRATEVISVDVDALEDWQQEHNANTRLGTWIAQPQMIGERIFGILGISISVINMILLGPKRSA